MGNQQYVVHWDDPNPWLTGKVGFRHIEGNNAVEWDNIKVTTGSPGKIVAYDDYDPWGMVWEGRSGNVGNADARFKFTGVELDNESGYFHFGQREYDARIGRFNRVDRLAGLYQNLSPYSYAANNPLSYVDINGDSLNPSLREWQRNVVGRGHSTVSMFGGEFNGMDLSAVRSDATSVNSSPRETSEAGGVILDVAEGASNAIDGILLLTPEGHGLFRGKDGRYWSIYSQPNGTTGKFAMPRATARLATGVNTFASGVQVVFSSAELYDAISSGNKNAQLRAGADLAMSGLSYFWPIGTAVAQTYFVTMIVVDHMVPYQTPPACAPIRCHGAYQQIPSGGPK